MRATKYITLIFVSLISVLISLGFRPTANQTIEKHSTVLQSVEIENARVFLLQTRGRHVVHIACRTLVLWERCAKISIVETRERPISETAHFVTLGRSPGGVLVFAGLVHDERISDFLIEGKRHAVTPTRTFLFAWAQRNPDLHPIKAEANGQTLYEFSQHTGWMWKGVH